MKARLELTQAEIEEVEKRGAKGIRDSVISKDLNISIQAVKRITEDYWKNKMKNKEADV